eukprot:TRINITY_DN37449_c0_g1_i1.p1 TRINITY_DN37449_c0_g1~~TRINITY_DN37449_c0_g1_i1.p1  ORF type:complete len:230 (+),score=49.93 TRINITY_DN37449_c0_g1_i1:96-785(+)
MSTMSDEEFTERLLELAAENEVHNAAPAAPGPGVAADGQNSDRTLEDDVMALLVALRKERPGSASAFAPRGPAVPAEATASGDVSSEAARLAGVDTSAVSVATPSPAAEASDVAGYSPSSPSGAKPALAVELKESNGGGDASTSVPADPLKPPSAVNSNAGVAPVVPGPAVDLGPAVSALAKVLGADGGAAFKRSVEGVGTVAQKEGAKMAPLASEAVSPPASPEHEQQ